MTPVSRRRAAQSGRVRRRVSIASVILLVAIALAACGAEIDTVMSVDERGAGQRVMTLTLAEDDVAQLIGGVAAADASIVSHLPDELAYSGIQREADGSLTATFTLTFDSPTDYISRASALLAAGSASIAAPLFTVSDSVLVPGASIEEDFTSYSLLRWMFLGMKADGVLDVSISESNMYELGDTLFDFAGQQESFPSGRLDGDLVNDRGFDEVSIVTYLEGLDAFTRTITYRKDAGQFQQDSQIYEDFLAANTPAGAELTGDGSTWTMSFSGDSGAIEAATDVALATTGSQLTIEAGPSPTDPATLDLTILDVGSCASVCSRNAPPLVDELTASADFAPSKLTVGMAGGELVRAEFVPAFASVKQHVQLELLGGVTATTEFAVDNASADLIGDGFEKLLAPDVPVGELKVVRGDEDTTYTVVIAGGSHSEFTAAYERWAHSGSLRTRESLVSSPLGGTTVFIFDSGLTELVGAHDVSERTTVVGAPFGMWVHGGSSSSDTVAPLTFQATGLTFGGLLALVAFVMLIALGVVLLLRYRRAAANSHSATQPLAQLIGTSAIVAGSRPSLLDFSYGFALSNVPSLLDMPSPTRTKGQPASLLSLPQTIRIVRAPQNTLVRGAFVRSRHAPRPSLIDRYLGQGNPDVRSRR